MLFPAQQISTFVSSPLQGLLLADFGVQKLPPKLGYIGIFAERADVSEVLHKDGVKHSLCAEGLIGQTPPSEKHSARANVTASLDWKKVF